MAEVQASAPNRKWGLKRLINQSSIQKFKNRSLASRRYWGQFCRSTSIHGMRYLAEPNRSWLERFWWISVVLLGFFTAAYYVSRQFVKWSQTAIEVDSYQELEDLIDIPFPAFTICDNRKIIYQNDTAENSKLQNLLYMLCGDDRIQDCQYTIEDFIEFSPPMIFDCELHSDDKKMEDPLISNCEHLLVRTLTDQGVCYTFNMFDPREIFKDHVLASHGRHGRPSDWTLETGFIPKAARFDSNTSDALKTGPFPKRAKNAIILNIFHEINALPGYCAAKSDGFKVILHSPHELPMVGFRESPWIPLQEDRGTVDKYIDIPAYGKILIDVRSRKIVASRHLNIYSINQRQCFFPGERKLAYFRHYSYNNCHLECLTNKTLEICKCKDFYMPTWDHDKTNTSKICTGDYEMRCIHHAFDSWDKNKHECHCYPTCTALEYDSKTWYNVRPIENERASEGMNKTVIVVYSTDDKYIKSERRAAYSLVDFIADCGGVFGLFCGMSIISILEFLYFGTLWFLETRKTRRKSRSQVISLD